ncbi:MAG: glycosyltransferase [Alphaproteobacteria bacterium]|nr:glycosyltransferase [Alphaproteobacteria bacterium]
MGKIVEVFFFDAGGGHRTATEALIEAIGDRFPSWCVKTIDLQTLLEPVDIVHQLTRRLPSQLRLLLQPFAPGIVDGPFRSQEFYNATIRLGQTKSIGILLFLLQHFIDSKADAIKDLLCKHWQTSGKKPDLVVSVIPNFNRFIFNALETVFPGTPYLTLMTDLADIPPRFWMENQDQFLICGTQTAFEQAITSGFYDPSKVFRVSGMILRKSFYRASRLKRGDLGLDEDQPVALISFGGNGSTVSEKVVDQIEMEAPFVQTIVLCGRDARLFNALKGRRRCLPVGFVDNVADYLRLSDVFIGKPGPGSISEALHVGCPVIVESNASTMPQEKPNVAWVLENGAGIAVKNLKSDVAEALETVIADLDAYRHNIKTNIPENHAVDEIVEILSSIAYPNSCRNLLHTGAVFAAESDKPLGGLGGVRDMF